MSWKKNLVCSVILILFIGCGADEYDGVDHEVEDTDCTENGVCNVIDKNPGLYETEWDFDLYEVDQKTGLIAIKSECCKVSNDSDEGVHGISTGSPGDYVGTISPWSEYIELDILHSSDDPFIKDTTKILPPSTAK